MNIVLIEPKMPANVGNIIRLCANTGAHLHLVGPMPFSLDDQKLKRAGLDYREWAHIQTYTNWDAFPHRSGLVGCSTRSEHSYHTYQFPLDAWLVFGSEDKGLSASIRTEPCWNHWIKIPMQPKSRSLNLANSVAVILYEALRQHEFPSLI